MKFYYVLILALLFACSQEQNNPDLIFDGQFYDMNLNNFPTSIGNTQEDSVGYALGLQVSMQMSQDSVPMDVENFVLGFIHGLNGDTNQINLYPMQFQQILTDLQTRMKARSKQAYDQRMHNYDSVSAFYFQNGKKFLETVPARIGLEKHPRGFWFKRLATGEGKEILMDQTAGMIMSMHLPADSILVWDNGTKEKPFHIYLNEALPPVEALWEEGLKIGDKFQIFAPAEQAFGEEGINLQIPRHAPLIINVEFVDTKPKKPFDPEAARRQQQMMQGGGGMPPQQMPPQQMPPQQMPPRR